MSGNNRERKVIKCNEKLLGVVVRDCIFYSAVPVVNEQDRHCVVAPTLSLGHSGRFGFRCPANDRFWLDRDDEDAILQLGLVVSVRDGFPSFVSAFSIHGTRLTLEIWPTDPTPKELG